MSLNFCDLVILGGDLSGIIAGALLAKRGLSVTVFDDDPDEPHRPNVVSGLDGKAFKSILGKLSIPEIQLQNISQNRISYQIITPTKRIDVSSDPTLTFRELHREFPEYASKLEEFYEEIQKIRADVIDPLLNLFPVSNGREKRTLIKKMKALPDRIVSALIKELPEDVTSFLKAQLSFLGGGSLLTPQLLQILFLLPLNNCTTFNIKGGIGDLKKIFLDKIENLGGAVQSGIDPFELIVEKGDLKGIQLTDSATRCRYFIGNTDIKKIFSLLPKPFWRRGLHKQVLRHAPSFKKFTLQYLTSKKVLPEQMSENLVVIRDHSKPLNGTNFIQINFDRYLSHDDDGLDTILTATCLLPPSAPEQTESEDITSIIKDILPFADTCLKQIFPRQEMVSNNTAFAYDTTLFFPGPNSPHKNLLLAGPNVLDWMGTDGKVLTAQKIVDLIWKKETKLRGI